MRDDDSLAPADRWWVDGSGVAFALVLGAVLWMAIAGVVFFVLAFVS